VPVIKDASPEVAHALTGGGRNLAPEARKIRQERTLKAGEDFAARKGNLRDLNDDWDRAFLAVLVLMTTFPHLKYNDGLLVPRSRQDQGYWPAVAFAREVSGANAVETVAYGTEAGLFQRAGIPAVVCGPGSIDQAHKPDEFLSTDQLGQCLGFLGRLAEEASAER